MVRKLLLGALALVALALVALAVWIATSGDDFLWSKIQPRQARLLALEDDPEIPSELSPAAWDEDLSALSDELVRRYRRFQSAATGGPVYDRAAFEAEGADLRTRLPELSREEIVLGLMGVAALPATGTGHTGIAPFQRTLDWRMYPLYAWEFDDGIWVTLAGSGTEEALGREIVAVGGVPAREIVARADRSLSADNQSSRRELHGAIFSFAEMLQAVGAAGPDGVAHLTLRSEGGELSELAVEPAHLASIAGLRWGRVAHSFVGLEAGDPFAIASPADPRPRARAFDFAYRPEDRLLFLRIDAMRENGDDTFDALVERLGAVVDENPVDRFVIDLRANSGGDNGLAAPLVDFLAGNPKIDRRGVLYTLIGRRTFSAAGNFAAALERRTKTLFAGEPSGSSPNHWGDAIEIVLPRSKLFVRISTRSWQDGGPWDRRPWIAPSPGLAVATNHDDHFAGRDPALAAVLAHRPEPNPEVELPPEAEASIDGSYRFGGFRRMTVEGRHMTIDGALRWAESDLYPVSVPDPKGPAPIRFATDMEGVFVEAGPDGLAVDWRGERHPLPRMAPDERTPIETLRGGVGERDRDELPTGDEVAAGVAAFRARAAEASGEVPDSWTEFELNRIGYALLGGDRVDAALLVFRLQAELFPEAANSHDSLGDGLLAAGDREGAEAAYREALARDADFGHSRRMLAELDADAEAGSTDSGE